MARAFPAAAGSRAGPPGAVEQRGDPRQLTALEELQGRATAGRDVGHLRGQAELLHSGHRVATADDHGRAVLGAPGEIARHGARAVAEGGHLEDAQRAVPEDRPGIVERRLERRPAGGPDIHRGPGVGDLVGGHDLVLGSARDLLGHDHIAGQHDAHALLRGVGEEALGVLDALPLEQALADRVALRDEECVGHASADDERVDEPHQVVEDLDLVGDLGPADDRRERLLGMLEQCAQGADLALHEQARVGRQELRHPDRRGMRAVGCAEGVVDVHVRIARQGLRELGIVGLLLGVEAQVLEHDHLPRLEARERVDRAAPERVAGDRHLHPQQLAEPLRRRAQAVGVVDLAAGAAEVAGEDDDRALVAQVADRGHRRPDAGVVGDLPVRKRHVEVHAHEDALAGGVQVADRELVHGWRPIAAFRGRYRRAPT